MERMGSLPMSSPAAEAATAVGPGERADEKKRGYPPDRSWGHGDMGSKEPTRAATCRREVGYRAVVLAEIM